jgi:hypothetical protein
MQEGEEVEMPEYRLYAVTRDNHFNGAPAQITCESDEDAILKAQEMVNGHDIELWSGNRRVSRIKGAREQRP